MFEQLQEPTDALHVPTLIYSQHSSSAWLTWQESSRVRASACVKTCIDSSGNKVIIFVPRWENLTAVKIFALLTLSILNIEIKQKAWSVKSHLCAPHSFVYSHTSFFLINILKDYVRTDEYKPLAEDRFHISHLVVLIKKNNLHVISQKGRESGVSQ